MIKRKNKNLNSYILHYRKINLKWITELNWVLVRVKTIKFPEEIIKKKS